MKLLLIFIDMLRPNLLYTTNGKKGESHRVDHFFERIGGTIYTNCYTPAPDTPRSIASMWTGCYPKNNGCDKRIKWPGYYLNSHSHLLSSFMSAGYQINTYTNPGERKAGLLPRSYEVIGNYNEEIGIANFLENLMLEEKSITFISLSDLHWVMDDWGYHNRSLQRGYDVLGDILETVEANLDLSQFDETVIFSDHGFKLHSELGINDKYELVNEDRTQTFLLYKKKGQSEINYCNRLTSIMDIFPTLLKAANLEEVHCDGLSLDVDEGHSFLLVEDFSIFTPEINQVADLWAVIDSSGVVYKRTLGGFKVSTNLYGPEMLKQFDEFIATHSKYYKELVNEMKMLDYYKNFVVRRTKYNNGQNRLQLDLMVRDLLHKKVIIFGASTYGQKVIETLGIPVAYIIDNNSAKWKTSINGVKIFEPETIRLEDKTKIAILVASSFYDEISTQLEHLGFVEFVHFWNCQPLVPY